MATNLHGNLINFYNANDFALASGYYGPIAANWVADQQGHKPEAFFFGGPSYIYYPSNQTTIAYYTFSSYTVTDMEERKALVARSRSSAVGAQVGLAGVIKNSLDLQVAFYFGSIRDEHS